MSLTFHPTFTYANPSPPDFTYLFSLVEQPANGPWVGAFAYAASRNVTVPDMPLDEFFARGVNLPQRYQHAGFLFLPGPPDTSGMADFRASLLAASRTFAFPAFGQNATLGGFVLWLDKLGAFGAADKWLVFPGRNLGNTACEYDLFRQAYRMFAAGGAGRTVFFDASSLGASTKLTSDANGLVLSLDATSTLAFGDTAPARPALSLSALSIPLGGATAGCIKFTGTNAGALTDFEFGFQYAVTESGQAPSRLWYPLLDSAETLAGATVNGLLDPFGSTDPVRNQMTVTPAGGTFVSAYRTTWDESITLRPSGSFVGAAAPDPTQKARLYFAPSGDFVMSVPGAAMPEHHLLCGLAAVEDLGFGDTDVLRFTPGQPADFAATPAAESGFSFSSIAGGDNIAWAVIAKVAGVPPQSIYRSESQRSPFFTPPPPPNGPLPTRTPPLLHDGFAMCALPQAPAALSGFPLLPYTAVPVMDGFGGEPGALAAFEAGYVAPTRSTQIRAMAPSTTDFGDPRIVALTPQGYVVGFDGKGSIVSIELGNAAGCKLVFAAKDLNGNPTGQPLPPDLRDAFLAPQQFIVASCATEAFKNNCTVTLAMSGWTFQFVPPERDKVAPGDYESVLIIKSAAGSKTGNIVQGSVADLAANPSVWTSYGLFNAADLDQTGQVLSSWLTTYIDNARALYADGSGLPGLQTFCELVDDPNWDGFIFLRVPLEPHAFDPNLSFLLAGVDVGQLAAHHIGCAVNHLAYTPASKPPDVSSYAQDSAFFGLVHYLKPGTPPGGLQASTYVPSTVPYDFQLLALEAVFENSALKTFSSNAIVVLNTLFGDGVLAGHDGPGPIATNSLVIRGTLQQHDGAPSYMFATAPGTSSTFYLSGAALDRIEIDRAVVVRNGDADLRSTVTFQMAGWMGTRLAGGTPAFDLLSYAAISFVNFGLKMSYDSNAAPVPGANKAFAPDLSGFAVSALPDSPFAGDVVDTGSAAANTLYRVGSLAASFPLELQDFVIGANSKSPSDMGYRALATNPKTGGAALGSEWYALALDLPLGGSGSLDTAGLITANLMFAWNAGGSGTPAFAPFIRLTGPGGVNLSFDLEGILKFGADGISLSQLGQGGDTYYVLTFASIGITVFTRSFPPKGSTNLLIAGLPDRTLGWFGAYEDLNAPPMTPVSKTASTPRIGDAR